MIPFDEFRSSMSSVPSAIRRRRAWRNLGALMALVAACGFFGFAMAMIWGGVW